MDERYSAWWKCPHCGCRVPGATLPKDVTPNCPDCEVVAGKPVQKMVPDPDHEEQV